MNIFTKKVFDKKAQKRKSSLLFQKGLSLIEASMVLALSAIVVSGVMYYYQAASDNNKTQSTVSEVMSIISAVNGLYVGTSGYAGLNESVIIKTSSIPENYKSTNGIMHPFGGSLTLGPTQGNTGYYIELANIPKSACVNLSSMNFGTSLGGVGVNTKPKAGGTQNIDNVGNTNGIGNFTKNALTPARASDACNQDENTIAFLLK